MLFEAVGKEPPKFTFSADEEVVFIDRAANYLRMVTVRGVHWEKGVTPSFSIKFADGTVKSNITGLDLDRTPAFLKVLRENPDAGFLRTEDSTEFYKKQQVNESGQHSTSSPLQQQPQMYLSQNISKALEPDENDLVDGYFDSPTHQLEEVISQLNSVPVTRNKIRCLMPGVWLNDEVINYYIELLKVLIYTSVCQHMRISFSYVPSTCCISFVTRQVQHPRSVSSSTLTSGIS